MVVVHPLELQYLHECVAMQCSMRFLLQRKISVVHQMTLDVGANHAWLASTFASTGVDVLEIVMVSYLNFLNFRSKFSS